MTFRPSLAMLSLLLLAQACSSTPATLAQKARTQAQASTAPNASPKAAPALLARPTGSVTVLDGAITLDANYIVASGAGNIVASGAGNIVASGAGNLISASDANLAVDQGNAVISNDGASLITNDGGGLITNDGGGLIGNDGGGLITNDGGSLITNDGGSLITNDGGSRRLLATSAVPVGQELPMVGAQVAVRSLATGQLLQLGQDAAGIPIKTIVSNRQGHFQVFLPPDAGVVRVETAFRGSGGQVRRYYTLAEPQAGSCLLDEDSQLLTRFLTEGYATRIAALLTMDVAAVTQNKEFALVGDVIKPFHDLAATMTPAQIRQASLRSAELLLSRPAILDHAPVYMLTGSDPARMAVARQRNEDRKLASAYNVLLDVFRTVRGATVARMRKQSQPEAYFQNLPQVKAYVRLLDPSFRFVHATDFPRFLLNAYLATPLAAPNEPEYADRGRIEGIQALLEGRAPNPGAGYPARYADLFPLTVDVSTAPALSASGDLGADGIPEGEAYRLSSGERAVSNALVEQLFTQDDSPQLQAQMMALLKAAKGS